MTSDSKPIHSFSVLLFRWRHISISHVGLLFHFRFCRCCCYGCSVFLHFSRDTASCSSVGLIWSDYVHVQLYYIVRMYFVMWLLFSNIYLEISNYMLNDACLLMHLFQLFSIYFPTQCTHFGLLFYFCPNTSIFTWFSEFPQFFLVQLYSQFSESLFIE